MMAVVLISAAIGALAVIFVTVGRLEAVKRERDAARHDATVYRAAAELLADALTERFEANR